MFGQQSDQTAWAAPRSHSRRRPIAGNPFRHPWQRAMPNPACPNRCPSAYATVLRAGLPTHGLPVAAPDSPVRIIDDPQTFCSPCRFARGSHFGMPWRTRSIRGATGFVQDCPRGADGARDVVRDLEPRQAAAVTGVEFRRQSSCLIDESERDVELTRQIAEGGGQRRTAIGARPTSHAGSEGS